MVKVGVKVRGQGRGVKVRVMIGGHKVGGQGRWSRSGYRSWGQVGEGSRLGILGGVRFGVKVLGQGCGQGEGSRSWSQCLGVKVSVMIGGHKVGVTVRGQGQGSGQGQGEGVKVWWIGVRWSVGEGWINSLFLS